MDTQHSTKGQAGGHGAALLLIDFFNTFEFSGADTLLRSALPAAQQAAGLKAAARRHGAAIVYANDHFGKWRSDFRQVVDHCIQDDAHGKDIGRLLLPDDNDHFVVKPKHSAFFHTPLDLLLQHLGVHTVVLAGVAGDGCILATALDAHMRDYRVRVVEAATASVTAARQRRAMLLMAETLDDIFRGTLRPAWGRWCMRPQKT
jgi:nicotinamidase-related amidase